MPTYEKEYDGFLFDQLTLIEDIERVAQTGDMEAVKAELSWKKKQVERKLYQAPPLRQIRPSRSELPWANRPAAERSEGAFPQNDEN